MGSRGSSARVAGCDAHQRPRVERLEGRRLLSVALVSQSNVNAGPGNGASEDPVVTPDGRYVAFVSSATDLAGGVAGRSQNVFVRDRVANTTRLASADDAGASGGAASHSPSISDDARFVAFASTAALVPADTNSHSDVYVRDLQAGTTTLVSVGRGNEGAANHHSFNPVISGDGHAVVFLSQASNLVEGVVDDSASQDLFVRDLRTNTTRLASVTSDGRAAGWAHEVFDVSFDGRSVAFVAMDLVPADRNGAADVYVRDVSAGVTRLVSVEVGGLTNATRSSFNPAMSDDGRFVAFESAAENLVPGHTGGLADVFVRDLRNNTTRQVSTATGTSGESGPGGNGESVIPAISRDGRFIAFASTSNNLVSPGDNNGEFDVYLRDTRADTTTLVSVKADGSAAGGIVRPRSRYFVSDDGRFVTFESRIDNVTATPDTNTVPDTFVRDLRESRTWMISTNGPGAAASIGRSGSHRMSADGTVVVFVSDGSDIAGNDTNAANDVFAAPVPGAAAPVAVVRRRVFYNDSAFDGHDPAPTPADLGAVAPDKAALLPGDPATFANVSTYARGINGILVDFAGVPPQSLTAADFEFRAGRSGPPRAWTEVTPAAVAELPGPAAGASSRYAITFATGAVRNTWLQVTVKANAATGLATPDVFSFGNLVGDAGASPLRVDAQDYRATRAALTAAGATAIDNPFDFDRDGRVTASDLVAARANLNAALLPITSTVAASTSTPRSAARQRAAYGTLLQGAPAPWLCPAQATDD